MKKHLFTVLLSASLGLGFALVSNDAHAADLATDIAQSKVQSPHLYRAVADAIANAETLDAHARKRGMPFTARFKALGPNAFLPMLDALASDARPPAGTSESAVLAVRIGLLEAVGSIRDERALPVIERILDRSSDARIVHAASTASRASAPTARLRASFARKRARRRASRTARASAPSSKASRRSSRVDRQAPRGASRDRRRRDGEGRRSFPRRRRQRLGLAGHRRPGRGSRRRGPRRRVRSSTSTSRLAPRRPATRPRRRSSSSTTPRRRPTSARRARARTRMLRRLWTSSTVASPRIQRVDPSRSCLPPRRHEH